MKYSYPLAPPSYPAHTPLLHSSPVEIRCVDDKGRGVYATARISPGTVIDISPVLLLSPEEYDNGINQSVLRGYVFTWRGREGGMALALGLGSMFNHSQEPNVSFHLDPEQYTITYTVMKSVEAGEELFIFYGHQVYFGDDMGETNADISDAEDDLLKIDL